MLCLKGDAMLQVTSAAENCLHAIYAREMAHRSANIIQQAMAAVSLSRKVGPGPLDLAMSRLTGAADLHRALGSPATMLNDIHEALETTCGAAIRAAGAEGAVKLHVIVDPKLVDARATRPLLMIAAELASNSIRHAFEHGRGSIIVDLHGTHDGMALTVEDDGTCQGWDRPGGQGRGIVDDLAAALRGRVRREVTSRGSARVSVEMPSVVMLATGLPTD